KRHSNHGVASVLSIPKFAQGSRPMPANFRIGTLAVSAPGPARSGRLGVVAQRCALALLLLAAWWAASLATPVYVLPSPQRVFARVVQLTQTGDLPLNLVTTLLRVLAGFVFAV